jgi:hypothetical protein
MAGRGGRADAGESFDLYERLISFALEGFGGAGLVGGVGAA